MAGGVAVVRRGSGRLAGLFFVGFQVALRAVLVIPPREARGIVVGLVLCGGVAEATAESAAR
eukprot:5222785-Alexandrium_andersonii.AAC.1